MKIVINFFSLFLFSSLPPSLTLSFSVTLPLSVPFSFCPSPLFLLLLSLFPFFFYYLQLTLSGNMFLNFSKQRPMTSVSDRLFISLTAFPTTRATRACLNCGKKLDSQNLRKKECNATSIENGGQRIEEKHKPFKENII